MSREDAELVGFQRAIAAAANAAAYYSTRRRMEANLMEPGRERDETRAMQRAGEILERRIRAMKMEED